MRRCPPNAPDIVSAFPEAVASSWVHEELHQARNFGPAQKKFGTFFGAAFAWLDQNLFAGRLPFTLRSPQPDYAALQPVADAKPIDYPET